MNILAFDTCLDKMYVTLGQEGKILASEIVENRDNKYHSAFLISTIKNVLKSNNLSPKDLDLVGTNIGPGSFTGIRACTTVARIMGQSLGIPVVGISSLEIISKITPEGKNALVALDARKNCAYLYMNDCIVGAIDLEEVKKYITNGDFFVITDDKLQSILGGISYQQKEYPLGDILYKLVFKKYYKKENEYLWQELKPLYIQPPPVVLKK